MNLGRTVGIFAVILTVVAAQDRPIIPFPWYLDVKDAPKLLAGQRDIDFSKGTECRRPCITGARRICYEELVIEEYQSMGAACGLCAQGVMEDCFRPQCVPVDGYERGILSINRQIPGPMLEGCLNDLFIIVVRNKMRAETTTIHWHGIVMQNNPYADGVPFVTQCPISPNSVFTYTFVLTDPGTFFYHSHSGIQRFNGLFGGFRVDQPVATDPSSKQYDVDRHVIILSDWVHDRADDFAVGLPTKPPGMLPESMLINGAGRFYINETNYRARTPYAIFNVERGKRYRFRLINAASSTCPIQLQFQNHSMLVIGTDSYYLKPKRIDTLFFYTGERYDVVIEANQTSGVFWIHARLIGLCEMRNIFQNALLSYDGNVAEENIPANPYNIAGFEFGITLNEPERSCLDDPEHLCLAELENPNSVDLWRGNPDIRLTMSFGIRQMNTTSFFGGNRYENFINFGEDQVFKGTINGFSYLNPPYPLVHQGSMVNPYLFCNADNIPAHCAKSEICDCIHVFHIPLGAVVELWLFDEAADQFPVMHPFHCHGFSFLLMKQGRIVSDRPITVEKLQELHASGVLNVTNPDLPIKDTVCVQNQGYVVLRFKAINPGPWQCHCHVEDHMVAGMSMLFLVGGKVPPPPPHFPKCYHFLPFPPEHSTQE